MKKIDTNNDVSMKRKVVIFSELLILLLVIGSSIAMAANGSLEGDRATKPVIAQENPDFVKYHTNKMLTQPVATLNDHKTGFVPAPVDLNYLSQTSTVDINTPA
ncbi:MAG: surface layer protein B, partial [Alphaproteobacteria bacterium]